jgi:hypothetical protein
VKRVLIICALIGAGSIAGIASCKQGEGERCQVDEDCTAPLVCNKAKNTCQSTTGGDTDANIVDAVPDAPPDTM